MKTITTLTLRFIRETNLARLYEKSTKTGANKVRQWVPRSVCPRTLKNGDMHEVSIEDWWLEQNPFEVKPQGQEKLL